MLAAVRRGVAFETALARELGDLPELDRRLGHELAAGVLRHRHALDALIGRYVPRGLASVSPPLLDVLRIGTYQLRVLDRVPAHAAVTTSVALARERVGERVTGFVNAVLRRIAALGPDPFAAGGGDPVARLAAQSSHPAWLVARWLERYGEEAAGRLLAWNNTPPSLTIQPTRGTLTDLQHVLDDAGVRSVPAPFGAGLTVEATRPERLPGFTRGAFFVQDPAQALVARFAAFPSSATVYDACAAPGGKSLALSGGVPLLIAADLSHRRVQRLRENLQRAGHGNERIVIADAAAPPIRPVAGYFLDAPCLATGSFARHPDARHRITAEALPQLAALQAALLESAAERTAPGGVLCYATCSLEPEENEGRITAFLALHPEFQREPPPDFPADLLTANGDLATLPQRDGMDGAFAARLVRSR